MGCHQSKSPQRPKSSYSLANKRESVTHCETEHELTAGVSNIKSTASAISCPKSNESGSHSVNNLISHVENSHLAPSKTTVCPKVSVSGFLDGAALQDHCEKADDCMEKTMKVPSTDNSTLPQVDTVNSTASNYKVNSTASNYNINSTASNYNANSAASNYKVNSTASNYNANSTASNYNINSTASNYNANSAASNYNINSTASNYNANSAASNYKVNSTASNYNANSTASNYNVNSTASNCNVNSTASNYNAKVKKLENNSLPKVGDKVLAMWDRAKWQYFHATIRRFIPEELKYEIEWDDHDNTGTIVDHFNLALDKSPSPKEVSIGSIVLFQQGSYKATRRSSLGGIRWHQGRVSHIYTTRDGKTLVNGYHTKGTTDEKWTTYKGYDYKFEGVNLSDLRIGPNIFETPEDDAGDKGDIVEEDDIDLNFSSTMSGSPKAIKSREIDQPPKQ